MRTLPVAAGIKQSGCQATRWVLERVSDVVKGDERCSREHVRDFKTAFKLHRVLL